MIDDLVAKIETGSNFIELLKNKLEELLNEEKVYFQNQIIL